MEARKAELKVRLQKALRRRIPQTAFDRVNEDGVIQDYWDGTLEHEGGEKENFQELKHRIARELNYLKAYDREKAETSIESPSNEVESSPPIKLETVHDSYLTKRADVISEVLAALADKRPDVTEFRQTVLGGGLLSSEEANTIVDAPGDTLGELRALELDKLGSTLANDYYGWTEEESVWYVLTGKTPRLRPIRIRARGKSPVEHYVPLQYDVTLSVLPWVPSTEVENAYRSVQAQLLEGPLRKTAPRTGPRVLEVVQFWWEQFRTRSSMLSWPACYELWNQKYPDKKFKEWRNFREYYRRGTKAAQPQYRRFPQPKVSDDEQEVAAAEEYTIKAIQGYRRIGDKYIEAIFQ